MTQPRGRTPQDRPRTEGFLQVPRRTFHAERGDPLWLEDRRFSRYEAWLDLVQLAQLRGRTVVWRNHTVTVPRAHALASMRTLADRWQWSKGAVERFVKWCVDDARLRTVSETPIGTLYLIVHYETYAGSRDTARDTQQDTSGDTGGTATGTRTEKGEKGESGENENGGGGARARSTETPPPAPGTSTTTGSSDVPPSADPDSALPYPENAARILTAHANKGLVEHVDPARRQIEPIRAVAPASVSTTAALAAAGVPLDFAAAALYELAKTHASESPVRSLAYLAPAVLRAWHAHQARADADALTPTTTDAGPQLSVVRAGGRPEKPKIDWAAIAAEAVADDVAPLSTGTHGGPHGR